MVVSGIFYGMLVNSQKLMSFGLCASKSDPGSEGSSTADACVATAKDMNALVEVGSSVPACNIFRSHDPYLPRERKFTNRPACAVLAPEVQGCSSSIRRG